MKWSRTRPSDTVPSNSGCRSTSRLTVSPRALATLTWPVEVSITPRGKHSANF